MPEHYKLVTFKQFPGDLERLLIDPKHRVSFPSKDWKTLVERNRQHLLNASRGIPPFTYRHPALYLDQNVVAVLEPSDYAEPRKERDLVELANGNIIDIYEINHELHARTAKIGGKTFLVAYPVFDWLLYYSKVTKGLNENDKLKWDVDNNYTIIEIDEKGRMVFTRFLDALKLSDRLGIKGIGPAVVMGKPEYLQQGTISDAQVRLYETRKPRKTQLGLPDVSGYGFEGILIAYPEELNQQAFPFNIHRTAPVHPRSSVIHPRISKKHGSNLPEQLGQHALNF